MFHRTILPFSIGIIAFCLIAAPLPAQGQMETSLRIVVTSAEDGAPLQGTNLLLMSPNDGSVVQAGATDRDGYHQMASLSPGQYIIQISHVGFETHRDTLQIEDERRLYSVALTVQPGQLEEVKVEGTRGAAERAAGMQTIRSTDIGRIPTPGPTGDLASYLQTLPGVVSVGDRGGQLYIRGGAPTQNRFLVDGLPIVQPFHISSFYSAFPQEIVQSVDLFAGGFGAEYGEAISSVLDVRLRPGNMKKYQGSAAIGPHLASVTAEGPIVQGEQSFLVSARYSLIEQTAEPLIGEDAPIGFRDFTGRYSFQRDNASCNVTTMLTRDEGSIGAKQDRELTWSNTVIGGRCLILDERFDQTFSIRAGYTGFENTAGTVGSPEQVASRWRLYLILNQDQTLLGQPVDFGGRITAGQYTANIDEQFVGIETLQSYQDMVRVHGSVEWSVNKYLTITPSLAGQVDLAIKPSFDPRIRLSVKPDGTDQQEFNFAAGIYRQIDEGISDERDAGNVFTVWRPPNLEDPLPEARQAIAGYRQKLGSSVEVSLEGYAKSLHDIPVSKWTPQAKLETETARADGIAYGADTRIELEADPLYMYVGYGWAKVKYEAATDDLGAWVGGDVFSYTPPHDRRHQLNAVSSYEIADVTANVSWEYGTGRPFTQVYGFDLALDLPREKPLENPGTAQTIFQRPYGARLPVYHRLDVSLDRSFDLSPRVEMEAKIGAINVYNRENVFYYDLDRLQRVDQSPFLPYFSLRMNVE